MSNQCASFGLGSEGCGRLGFWYHVWRWTGRQVPGVWWPFISSWQLIPAGVACITIIARWSPSVLSNELSTSVNAVHRLEVLVLLVLSVGTPRAHGA